MADVVRVERLHVVESVSACHLSHSNPLLEDEVHVSVVQVENLPTITTTVRITRYHPSTCSASASVIPDRPVVQS